MTLGMVVGFFFLLGRCARSFIAGSRVRADFRGSLRKERRYWSFPWDVDMCILSRQSELYLQRCSVCPFPIFRSQYTWRGRREGMRMSLLQLNSRTKTRECCQQPALPPREYQISWHSSGTTPVVVVSQHPFQPAGSISLTSPTTSSPSHAWILAQRTTTILRPHPHQKPFPRSRNTSTPKKTK
jgi:hypothetical protein